MKLLLASRSPENESVSNDLFGVIERNGVIIWTLPAGTELPNGCVVMFNVSSVPELWQLTNYKVSSVTAGCIFLVPILEKETA